jgi:hypothetical protein
MRVLLIATLLIQAIASTSAHANGDTRDTSLTSGQMVDLEKAFWVCDYAGTRGMVDPSQGAVCIVITDELKRVKFDGDFDRLVAWWKVNKMARHQELERAPISAPQSKHASSAI